MNANLDFALNPARLRILRVTWGGVPARDTVERDSRYDITLNAIEACDPRHF
ncbi:MAG: hypothetical protein WB586_18625 [Chthoniobacterales bacterium]